MAAPDFLALKATPAPANPVPPLMMVMMSLSRSVCPLIGQSMAFFLMSLSMHSIVTTSPLGGERETVQNGVNGKGFSRGAEWCKFKLHSTFQ